MYGYGRIYGVGPIDLPVLLKQNLIISMGNLSLAEHHKVAYKRKRTRYPTPRIIFDAWSLYLCCAVFYRKLNSCMPYCVHVQHASPITSSRHRCFVVPVRLCYVWKIQRTYLGHEMVRRQNGFTLVTTRSQRASIVKYASAHTAQHIAQIHAYVRHCPLMETCVMHCELLVFHTLTMHRSSWPYKSTSLSTYSRTSYDLHICSPHECDDCPPSFLIVVRGHLIFRRY